MPLVSTTLDSVSDVFPVVLSFCSVAHFPNVAPGMAIHHAGNISCQPRTLSHSCGFTVKCKMELSEA
jgi:hypothetical protein